MVNLLDLGMLSLLLFDFLGLALKPRALGHAKWAIYHRIIVPDFHDSLRHITYLLFCVCNT